MVAIFYGNFRRSLNHGMVTLQNFQCGLAHQRASILYQILFNAGIKSSVVQMGGHTVVLAWINNQFYFLDPDFGVGPISVKRLDSTIKSFKKVKRLYIQQGVNDSQATWLASLFIDRGSHIPYWSKGGIFNFKEERENFMKARIAQERVIRWIRVIHSNSHIALLFTAVLLYFFLFHWAFFEKRENG